MEVITGVSVQESSSNRKPHPASEKEHGGEKQEANRKKWQKNNKKCSATTSPAIPVIVSHNLFVMLLLKAFSNLACVLSLPLLIFLSGLFPHAFFLLCPCS